MQFGETFSESFTAEFIIISQRKKKKNKSTTLIVLFKVGGEEREKITLFNKTCAR